MTTIGHHDAEGPEEAMKNLPQVVPSGSASGGLRQAEMSERPAAEDPVKLAQAEPGLRHSLEVGPAYDANTTAGNAACSGAIRPTYLERRERPVQSARH